jgi:hypothetical protein
MAVSLMAVFGIGCATLLYSLRIDAQSAYVSQAQIVVESIPSSEEEFERWQASIANTPEGAAASFIVALNIYTADKDLGLPCVAMTLHNDPLYLEKSDHGIWKGFDLTRKALLQLSNVDAYTGTARSFIEDTDILNDYSLPPLPWSILVLRNRLSEFDGGDIKVFVVSSGADRPRPVFVRRDDRGIWKVNGFSSLVMTVKKPPLESNDGQ